MVPVTSAAFKDTASADSRVEPTLPTIDDSP